MYWPTFAFLGISIHAPSRERQLVGCVYGNVENISIHAPSRERRVQLADASKLHTFQSTLPRGSDEPSQYRLCQPEDFNPRSLAGATMLLLR